MKVAIVCDWLTGIGGAERVVLELHQLFPKAPIYTSQYDPTKLDWFKDADVRTTWLQQLNPRMKKFLPVLRARAFGQLDLSAYDLVISSTGAEAKDIKTRKNATHVCYMHAPTHYYWSRYNAYVQNPGFPTGFNWLAKCGLKLLVGPLRRWDYRAAQRPDYIIANSTHTQSDIKKYYGRSSTVIHPPVDTQYFSRSHASKKPQPRSGFVIAGRLTPYKRFDLAVTACSQLGLKLTVIGTGPEQQKLKNSAGPSVTFLGNASRQQQRAALQSAEAFIFPGLDDFGIAPVEAMAAGTPVIAYQAGGALDYVTDHVTGIFFKQPTPESLCQALKTFKTTPFDTHQIAAQAQAFAPDVFKAKLLDFLTKNT